MFPAIDRVTARFKTRQAHPPGGDTSFSTYDGVVEEPAAGKPDSVVAHLRLCGAAAGRFASDLGVLESYVDVVMSDLPELRDRVESELRPISSAELAAAMTDWPQPPAVLTTRRPPTPEPPPTLPVAVGVPQIIDDADSSSTSALVDPEPVPPRPDTPVVELEVESPAVVPIPAELQAGAAGPAPEPVPVRPITPDVPSSAGTRDLPIVDTLVDTPVIAQVLVLPEPVPPRPSTPVEASSEELTDTPAVISETVPACCEPEPIPVRPESPSPNFADGSAPQVVAVDAQVQTNFSDPVLDWSSSSDSDVMELDQSLVSSLDDTMDASSLDHHIAQVLPHVFKQPERDERSSSEASPAPEAPALPSVSHTTFVMPRLEAPEMATPVPFKQFTPQGGDVNICSGPRPPYRSAAWWNVAGVDASTSKQFPVVHAASLQTSSVTKPLGYVSGVGQIAKAVASRHAASRLWRVPLSDDSDSSSDDGE